MAISKPHYELLKYLCDRGSLPRGVDILEIGQANLYGDFNGFAGKDLFEQADSLYKELIDPKSITSIDQGGTARALRLNLNEPIDLEIETKFGLVFNHGTAEHIFNIANVFRVAHDYCAIGGLMIHEAPWLGWHDHGFYSLQPTLFYDLSRANNYRIELMVGEDISAGSAIVFESREDIIKHLQSCDLPTHCQLFVALRKLHDKPFSIPTQGVYCGMVSDTVRRAWSQFR